MIFKWLFNVYIDGVVPEVNARVLSKGMKLLRVRMVEGLRWLLFAEDTALSWLGQKSCADWRVSLVKYAKN